MTLFAPAVRASRGLSVPVQYKKGSFSLLPKRYTVDGRLVAPRTPNEITNSETTVRTVRPQLPYFDLKVTQPHQYSWQKARDDFYNVETHVITKAFDTPELIPVFLRDQVIAKRSVFTPQMLDAAAYWVHEARYWRAIGMSKAFYTRDGLRAYAWANKGSDIGRVHFSAAMIDAVKDLERAVKRKEAGLEPNYVWDNWGPCGFIDGQRADFLPRFKHNPYVDPDGVDVTDDEISGFVSHEQLKERYGWLIWGDVAPFQGAFLALSNASVTMADLPSEVSQLFGRLNGADANDDLTYTQDDVRALLFLVARPELLASAQAQTTWQGVLDELKPHRESADRKIDAARLFFASRSVDDMRAFYEEKCGFNDFMRTNDKTISAAVEAHIADIKQVATAADEWGPKLAVALTDRQRELAMGKDAFAVFRTIEDIILDKRRRLWTSRFVEDAKEEKTLDFMLQNFGRRAERPAAKNQPGQEFDREQEPIGRKVQRRVMESDKTAQSVKGPRLSFQERVEAARRKTDENNPLANLDFSQFAHLRSQ